MTLKFTLGQREWLGGGRTGSRKRQETLVFMDRVTMGLTEVEAGEHTEVGGFDTYSRI